MQVRSFGTTDLTVSQLCMGTMQFGWTADERSSFAVLDGFVNAGGNFLDTADMYSNWAPGNSGGVSEEILGRWLKERGNRDRMVVYQFVSPLARPLARASRTPRVEAGDRALDRAYQ